MCHHAWNLGIYFVVLFIFSLKFIWCVCSWNNMPVGVRWQFVGVSRLFLSCGSSGHQLGGKYLYPLSHLAGPCYCNSHVSFAQMLWWLSLAEWKESRFRNMKWRFCDCVSVAIAELEFKLRLTLSTKPMWQFCFLKIPRNHPVPLRRMKTFGRWATRKATSQSFV